MNDDTLEDEVVQARREWRNERLLKIENRENLTFPISDDPRLIVHLQPLRCSPFASVDLSAMKAANLFIPWLSSYDSAFTIDGFVAIQVIPQVKVVGDYVQVFHDGTIEATEAILDFPPDSKRPIGASSCEKKVAEGLPGLLTLQQKLGVPCPIMVSMSFVGVRERTVESGSMGFGRDSNYRRFALATNIVTLPEARIDAYSTDPLVIPPTMRATFNALWNAAGLSRSPSFNDKGEWAPPAER